MTGQAHLIIECHRQLGFVTPIGNLVCSKTNDVAGGAGHGVMGWFDFGGDDLHGPDTITHLGTGQAKNLGAFLGTFSRIRDNLNGVL